MRFDRDILMSPAGQIVLVAAVLLVGVLAMRSRQKTAATTLPVAKAAAPSVLPQTFTRDGTRFVQPPAANISLRQTAVKNQSTIVAPVLPLSLFTAPPEVAKPAPAPRAPYGRMIPCQTVVAIESNRLETPIIGLVTEDLWHDGKRIVPAGAEVHGRAVLDRTRERIGAQTQWRIVWRTTDAENGTEIVVDGVVLDREPDADSESWGPQDGSAGLRGQLVKSDQAREMKLFSAAFLATATAALQENKLASGLIGETSVPVSTARNAVLAGTGAVLREYAQSIRDAIARDGFFLRVPAGKPFYLYVTQTIDRGQDVRATQITRADHPSTQ